MEEEKPRKRTTQEGFSSPPSAKRVQTGSAVFINQSKTTKKLTVTQDDFNAFIKQFSTGKKNFKEFVQPNTQFKISRYTANNIDLKGKNLEGVNLCSAILTGANLSRANLSKAKLIRTILKGANLIGTNLTGANLYRANLTGANLTEANLEGVNLDSANLTGAILINATPADVVRKYENSAFTTYEALASHVLQSLNSAQNETLEPFAFTYYHVLVLGSIFDQNDVTKQKCAQAAIKLDKKFPLSPEQKEQALLAVIKSALPKIREIIHRKTGTFSMLPQDIKWEITYMTEPSLQLLTESQRKTLAETLYKNRTLTTKDGGGIGLQMEQCCLSILNPSPQGIGRG